MKDLKVQDRVQILCVRALLLLLWVSPGSTFLSVRFFLGLVARWSPQFLELHAEATMSNRRWGWSLLVCLIFSAAFNYWQGKYCAPWLALSNEDILWITWGGGRGSHQNKTEFSHREEGCGKNDCCVNNLGSLLDIHYFINCKMPRALFSECFSRTHYPMTMGSFLHWDGTEDMNFCISNSGFCEKIGTRY